MSQPDAKEPSFVVTDRRHFTSAGERRSDVPEETSSSVSHVDIGVPPSPATSAAAPAVGRASAGEAKAGAIPFPTPPPPEPIDTQAPPPEPVGAISFLGFLESLYATAMMQLGAPAPGQISRPEADLEGAQQTIEILGLLQQKTQGNLTAAEAQALEEILYELRMVFVQLTRKQAR